jgi:flavorubredoxin
MTLKTAVEEIADNIFRLSTYFPDVAPDGFTVNQFLLRADEPLLFHCGYGHMFPMLQEAAGRVLKVRTLRWVAFGHTEADEMGAMNQWLDAAPDSQAAQGAIGCTLNVGDLADRAPRALADGERIDLGGLRVRWIDTPHVPHGWDAGIFFEERTSTLLCGDLFTHGGPGPAVREDDVVERALAADDEIAATCLTPDTAPLIRRLADLEPRTLALMHGSSYDGDCVEALHALADGYEHRLLSRMP